MVHSAREITEQPLMVCAGMKPSNQYSDFLVRLLFKAIGHLGTGSWTLWEIQIHGIPGVFFIGPPIIVRWSTVGLPDVLSHERMLAHFRQHGLSRRGPPPRIWAGSNRVNFGKWASSLQAQSTMLWLSRYTCCTRARYTLTLRLLFRALGSVIYPRGLYIYMNHR